MREPETDEKRTRECGPCTACCTVLGVEEIGKAAGVRCEYVAVRCSIYGHRPGACAKYACMWLAGLGTDESIRPDVCGVMMTFETPSAQLAEEAGIESYLSVRETFEGGFEKMRGMLNALSEKIPIVLVDKDKRTLLGPRDIVTRTQMFFQKRSEK